MAVSGTHARIEAVASAFVIRDLDSTNGTFVNKKKVSMHNLRHNDIILIGKHTILFDLSDAMPKSGEKEDLEVNDKTRILDTSEYRELIQAEQKASRESSAPEQELETEREKDIIVVQEANEKTVGKSFMQKLFSRFFR